MPENEEFYKEKAWEMVLKQLGDLQKDVTAIRSRVDWVYGWAAGVALVVSIIWNVIRDKIWR